MKILRTLILAIISAPRLLYAFFVGRSRQRQALLDLEQEAGALGFGFWAFDHDTPLARLLGRFGDVYVDGSLLNGKHGGLILCTPLPVIGEVPAADLAWVEEQLEAYRAAYVGWFGEVELRGDEVRVRYEGFAEGCPVVTPRRLDQLVTGLVEVAGRFEERLRSGSRSIDLRARLFFEAVESADTEAMPFYLAHGADATLADSDGRTGLHRLPFEEEEDEDTLEVAGMLLRAGADPNAVDGNGQTPLMLAAEHGDLAMVRWLLEHGADPSKQDHLGETALTCADGYTHLEEIKRLLTKS